MRESTRSVSSEHVRTEECPMGMMAPLLSNRYQTDECRTNRHTEILNITRRHVDSASHVAQPPVTL